MPEAKGLAAPFETEAERLWAEEKVQNTLTAVASAQLISSTSSSQGRDDCSNQVLIEGIQMGKRMGRKLALRDIFGVAAKLPKYPVSSLSDTLYGSSNWLTGNTAVFGVGNEDASALVWLDHHADWFRAACHTSWGIFSCAW